MKKGLATVWVIVITVIVMAGLGTGGWYFMDDRFARQKKDSDEKIASLEKELKILEEEAAEIDIKSSTSTDSGASSSISSDTEANNILNTYTSTAYGYSFRYPKTYSLVDWLWNGLTNSREPQNGKVVWVSKTALSEKAILMDADPVSQYLSFTVSDQLCKAGDLAWEDIKLEEIKFLGYDAWKTTVTDNTNHFGGNYESSINVNKGSKCYRILWVNNDASGTHDLDIDPIVDSFRFL